MKRLAILLLILSIPAFAADLNGRVVGISDGDTLTLLTADKQQVKIRLGEIDTPESNQPYGTKAKQALSELAFNKQVRAVEQDKDRYGRTVARVYVGSVDVNAEMVRLGAAWVYRDYAKDQNLFRLEAQAKAAKSGLWGLSEAERCPPWDWRKGACATAAATQPPPGFNNARSTGSFSCSTVKKRCAEMRSCDEARFYLAQCGIRTLDGNHDGVPCEALCGR